MSDLTLAYRSNISGAHGHDGQSPTGKSRNLDLVSCPSPSRMTNSFPYIGYAVNLQLCSRAGPAKAAGVVDRRACENKDEGKLVQSGGPVAWWAREDLNLRPL